MESMGKSAKTFTIDIKVLAWLEEYAKKENKKESYIVNQMLNSEMRQAQTWKCPECTAVNDNRWTDCHDCDYVVSVKA